MSFLEILLERPIFATSFFAIIHALKRQGRLKPILREWIAKEFSLMGTLIRGLRDLQFSFDLAYVFYPELLQRPENKRWLGLLAEYCRALGDEIVV